MCKNWTSLEQSKKLIKLGLDRKTADIWYQYIGDSFKDGITKPVYFPMVIRDSPSEKDISCWSLSALLNLVKGQYLIEKCSDNSFKVTYLDYVIYEYYLLDAVFELVCKLIKDNKLK